MCPQRSLRPRIDPDTGRQAARTGLRARSKDGQTILSGGCLTLAVLSALTESPRKVPHFFLYFPAAETLLLPAWLRRLRRHGLSLLADTLGVESGDWCGRHPRCRAGPLRLRPAGCRRRHARFRKRPQSRVFEQVVTQETRRALASVDDPERIVPWLDTGRFPHDGDPMSA